MIEVVDIERETESSVWINGSRCGKLTEYHSYFDTFIEAKSHLLAGAERKVKNARFSLQQANDYYGNVKGLKEL
jgi:hypothetical protein